MAEDDQVNGRLPDEVSVAWPTFQLFAFRTLPWPLFYLNLYFFLLILRSARRAPWAGAALDGETFPCVSQKVAVPTARESSTFATQFLQFNSLFCYKNLLVSSAITMPLGMGVARPAVWCKGCRRTWTCSPPRSLWPKRRSSSCSVPSSRMSDAMYDPLFFIFKSLFEILALLYFRAQS